MEGTIMFSTKLFSTEVGDTAVIMVISVVLFCWKGETHQKASLVQ